MMTQAKIPTGTSQKLMILLDLKTPILTQALLKSRKQILKLLVQKRPKIEAAKNSLAAITISRKRQRILKEF